MIRSPQPLPFEEAGPPSRSRASFIPWRLAFLACIAATVIIVFWGRLYFLAVMQGQQFFELSEDNFLRTTPIEAPRGKLLASDGTPISLNRPLYEIRMSRFRLEKEVIGESLARLSVLLGDPKILKREEEIRNARPSWKPVLIARDLDSEAVAPVIERLYELPGVQIEPRFVRHHPEGSILGHVTGYVGNISRAQLPEYLPLNYLQTDLVGKISAEKQFESFLRGRHGSELTILDAFGRLRSSHVQDPAERGNDVHLTIELRLQRLADRLLQGHSGVLIVMDPRDGALLTMASKPDYDPNHPTQRVSTDKTSSYNKSIRGYYAPASTFKLVTASAGLLHGFDPTAKINCPGRFHLPNVKRPFYCDVRWGHGPLNMQEAIQRSCNVFFYTWADRLGHERLYQTARAFGFGEPSGVDLVQTELEARGVLREPGSPGIYRGSVIQMGIGQGALVSATPLQILGAYAALANGGVRVRPHVLREVTSPQGKLLYRYETQTLGRLPLDSLQMELLRDGFHRVVQKEGGTGFARGFKPEWDVAGKTGSGEVGGQKLTNGLFVGYAPFTDPEIIILGIIEGEGHGSSTALPLVVELMAEYFEPGSGKVPGEAEAIEVAAGDAPFPAAAATGSESASVPPPARPASVAHMLTPQF